MKTLSFAATAAATVLSASMALSTEIEHGIEFDVDANVHDSTTGVLGISHVTLSVRDLDTALAFYSAATDFPVIRQQTISAHPDSDTLYAGESLSYRSALLKAPNMMFELVEFAENNDIPVVEKNALGPGMTHTCFQSPADFSGFDRFDAAGAKTISFGGAPVDLGGYGVTYAYALDPDGNMIELEQLDGEILARAGYDAAWAVENYNLWMTQVALATHDMKRLMGFYGEVLGFMPYRVSKALKDNPKADAIAGIENVEMIGGWFRMNETSKVIEIWEFANPLSPAFEGNKSPRTLGYSYILEVADAHDQYERLQEMGVHTFSPPVAIDGGWQFYARDIDGNVFGMRQSSSPDAAFSVSQLDKKA